MKPNRSMQAPAVIPVLIYPDVRETVAWLSTAFGFVERVQIGENHRSQLTLGDGAIIVADVRNERTPPRPGEVSWSNREHRRTLTVVPERAGQLGC